MTIKVILSMPLYPNGQLPQAAARTFHAWALAPNPNVEIVTRLHSATSAAQLAYDVLWSGAINQFNEGGATHYCRIDCDVIPIKPNWLGVMVEELQKHDADIMAAVVPIKDDRGLTTTCIDDTGDIWSPRRLTMTEIFDRHETFTDPKILLNTGLYLVDLSKPWVQAKNPDGSLAVSHHMRNKVVMGSNGRWEARMRSEDWELSRDVRKVGGVRQFATRKVELYHEHQHYANWKVWGTERADPENARNLAGRAILEGAGV